MEDMERKEFEKTLRICEEAFHPIIYGIMQGSPIPQFVIDRDHKVIYWNKALEKYSGIMAKDVIGTDQHWRAFYKKKRPCMADLLVDDKVEEIAKWYAGKYSKSGLLEGAYAATDFFPELGEKGKWLYFTAAAIKYNGEIMGAVETLEDVTERKRAEEAVKFANAYNRSLIEASMDPLVTIAPDGKITDVNKATEAVTGYSRAKLIGTHFSDYFTDPKKASEGYLEVFETGSVTDYPLEIRHHDGHVTPVLYNASVYKDEAGKVIGVFAAARDITERKRAEELLQEAKRQAEMYVELMGHDINNLNQVGLSYLELALKEPGLSEDAKRSIEKALGALNDSSRLISNVEKLQRISTAKVKVEKVDIGQMLADVRARYLETPGKVVTINYTPEKECFVWANELLVDVFSNIVENAIKHSIGPVTIDIRPGKMIRDGRNYCMINVEDNGPGIPDELKERLFTRFQRGITRAGGKGLGLYLVKSLVESFGGRVWAEDRVTGDSGKGSRFVVMLPSAGA